MSLAAGFPIGSGSLSIHCARYAVTVVDVVAAVFTVLDVVAAVFTVLMWLQLCSLCLMFAAVFTVLDVVAVVAVLDGVAVLTIFTVVAVVAATEQQRDMLRDRPSLDPALAAKQEQMDEALGRLATIERQLIERQQLERMQQDAGQPAVLLTCY